MLQKIPAGLEYNASFGPALKHQSLSKNSTLKQITLLLFIILFAANAGSQIVPQLSARVNTSHVDIKKVYHLYSAYLNSRPDSIYQNPNWNPEESVFYLNKSKMMRVDRSANQMFRNVNAAEYLAYHQPKILQIDSVGIGRYQIKTMFAASCPEEEYSKFTPDCITKLYAVRDSYGDFKLENTLGHDTKNWKTYQYEFITYLVHPSCRFSESEARDAVKFCKDISKKFGLAVQPFKYYILPDADEMGQLYNFDYWLSYMGGQTNTQWREIFTTNGSLNYQHELVHIVFPVPTDKFPACPLIVNEGIATWLAGPKLNLSFERALKEVSATLRTKNDVSLEDIRSFRIRNDFDNNILYVTGAVICKLVFEKHGKKGIWDLYNCTNETFNATLEKLFGTSYKNAEELILDYIIRFDGNLKRD